MSRLLRVFLLLAFVAPAAAACNTISGIGEDVSATGDAVTNTADKAKDEM